MTRHQHNIVESWAYAIQAAIRLGDANAAYRLTVGLVRRLRELRLE